MKTILNEKGEDLADTAVALYISLCEKIKNATGDFYVDSYVSAACATITGGIMANYKNGDTTGFTTKVK